MSNITFKNPRDEVVRLMERIRNPFNRGDLNLEKIASMATPMAMVFIGDGIVELNKNIEKLFSTMSEVSELRQRIYELEETQRWIPIAETYPPEMKLVDIVVDRIAKRGRWYEGDACDVEYPSIAPRVLHWEVFDEEEGQLVPLDTPNMPTHWRPLPEPPDEK